MVKKKVFMFIVWAAIVAFVTPVKAQMTDDAVVSYVEAGLSNGKSQDMLIKELATKGVTKEQGERIKKKMEESRQAKMTMNTVGLTKRERALGNDDLSSDELEASAIKRPAIDSTAVFGRNIFSIKELSFAPVENLPTPADYKLGAGDEVIIDIWGTNQATIRQTISPDGFINIDAVGLVSLNGMTVKEAENYMRRQLGRIYSVSGEDAQSDIKLTLGSLRTIMVNVVGEVVAPGTYSLSSLSTVYHALYRAGGFNELASVRNVSLVRKGKKVADIDVYDLIVEGKSADNVALRDGDVVLVPTYESVVSISGNVKRPMKYEMKQGESVENLIVYAGGFKGNAYTENLNIERRNGREYQVYTVDKGEYASFNLIDGDNVTVGAIIDRYENRLEIKGAVYRPGFYQLSDKVNTVSELIAMADGLKGDAFLNRALLHREREDYTLELIQVDLKGILNGSVADIELRKNDVLTISSTNDLNDWGFITVVGEVNEPGIFKFAANTTVEDIILQAGGLLESASTAKVDVSRRIKNRDSMEDTDTLSKVYSFEISAGYEIGAKGGFVLEPYDQVYVRRSPGYSPQNHVKVEGEVIFPGTYALTHKETRLSDVVKMAGGTASRAYTKGSRLTRQMTTEERARLEATLDMLENAKDSMNVAKIDAASTYDVGINLELALANPGSDADVVLREGDVIIVPEYINTVKVTGDVLYPNTVTYNAKMTVEDYVTQAGGYGFGAKKNRAYVVYMNGTVARARRNSKTVVEPGCEIIVPERRKKEGSLQSILSVASTSASLATMFATIYNIIK